MNEPKEFLIKINVQEIINSRFCWDANRSLALFLKTGVPVPPHEFLSSLSIEALFEVILVAKDENLFNGLPKSKLTEEEHKFNIQQLSILGAMMAMNEGLVSTRSELDEFVRKACQLFSIEYLVRRGEGFYVDTDAVSVVDDRSLTDVFDVYEENTNCSFSEEEEPDNSRDDA